MNTINSSTMVPPKAMDRPAPQKEAPAETAKHKVDSSKAETAKSESAKAKELDQQAAKSAEQSPESKDAKNQEDPEISEYLKGISRLENKLKEEEITDEDLGKLMSKLEEKILSLSAQQKKVLKNMEFWMQGDLETVTEFTEYVADNLKSKDDRERDKAIDFLKDPQFISLIDGKEEEDLKAQGYGPSLNKPAPRPKEEAAKAETAKVHEEGEAKPKASARPEPAPAAAAKQAPARPPGSGTSIRA